MKNLYHPDNCADTVIGTDSIITQLLPLIRRARQDRTDPPQGLTSTEQIVAEWAWFENTWGIRFVKAEGYEMGAISDITIVDEQKYLLFIMKYK